MSEKRINLELTFDDPVPEDRAQLIAENTAGVSGGWMTRNEARQRIGLESIPGGDVFLMPVMLQEVPVNSSKKDFIKSVKSSPLFVTEAQCEAYWTDYVKRAGAFEKQAIFALETLFRELEKEALSNLESLKNYKGGEGSGNYGHEGRPGEIGGSGEGGAESGLSSRAQRAKESHKTSTATVQRQAEGNEPKVAQAIQGKQTEDNDAFDVLKGNNAVEIKTIVRGKNDKITMHPTSLAKKEKFAEDHKLTTHTVVFDDRNQKIYYKQGLGSFRLRNMQSISSLSDLQGMIKSL